MAPSPTLERFAEQVATEEADHWLARFIEVVESRVPDSSDIGLFIRQRHWPKDQVVMLVSAGQVPAFSLPDLESLPRRERDAVLLPIPCLEEGGGALWIRTSETIEKVQEQLCGWLALVGMGLARRKQHHEAARQREARDHFFSMINHDLKAPLASVKAMTDLIVRKVERGSLDPATEEGRNDLMERLTFLSRRVKDLATLIDEIGDVSTIERERLTLNLTKADLGSILRASTERIDEETGREIRVEDSGQPLPMSIDKKRLAQVFHILLQNAIDYSEADSPVTVRLSANGTDAHVEILDKGRGISAEQQARLFHEYGRAVQGASSGLGVGLYIAAALVAAHGGMLELESQPGQGTAVRVSLPLEGRRQKDE